MNKPESPGTTKPPPNAVGFLRVVLATFVIYTHAHLLGGFSPEWMHRLTDGRLSLGTLAVQCFFVISGWLLIHSWRRRPALWPYLRNRAARLLPAWWVCLVVTALVFAPIVFFTSRSVDGFWLQEPGPISYIFKNLIFPRSQIAIGQTLSTNAWGSDWNGSLWTLFYEGSAYLLLAAAGLAGLLRRRASWGLEIILGLLLVNALWQLTATPNIAGRLFDTPGKNLCLYFAGGMAVVLAPATWRERLTSKTAGCICALLLIPVWKSGAGPALSPMLLPSILLALATNLPLRQWESRVGGDYSYGLYVYAYPVQQMLAHFGVQKAGFSLYLLVGFVTTLAFAVASWKWIESPALRLKSHVARQGNTAPSLA
ncbi:MAG TPA: acyltransferase [Rariglobus sp.]|jgi:peptidoglycan/LPS O-acetylase OafA/YrhL|nr:acyltransferase [Rariglobus sp.]